MEMNKGHVKLLKGAKIFQHDPNKDVGKRRVKVNANTWVLTSEPTDELAIEKYNRRYTDRDKQPLRGVATRGINSFDIF